MLILMPLAVKYLKTSRTMINRQCLPALVWIALASSASALELNSSDALELRLEGRVVPFETIYTAVEQLYPQSRILEVELDDDDDRLVYEIEILTTERSVRELEFDAQSGELLDDELED